jgi:uroporphyrinogen III methyltransferase / synthase
VSEPPRPLAGRRVLVTRRWPELVAGLASLGAIAYEAPLIELRPPSDTRPLDTALAGLARYDWLVFTSANAVEAVAARMAALGLALPVGLGLASVGPATTQAVHAAWPGARVTVEPVADFRAAGLVAAFDSPAVQGRRVLLPVSDRAAETVSRGLAERGALVDRVVAYRTVSADGGQALTQTLRGGVDVAVFASPSAVEAFAAFAGEDGRAVPAAVIGPTTAEAARAAGLAVLAVAQPSTVEGLLRALEEAWR